MEGCQLRKHLTPVKRKAAVEYVTEKNMVKERRTCRVLGVNRNAYCYEVIKLPDEDEVWADIINKACNFGQVGYPMVTDMMRNEGKLINHKRMERIWRKEGLTLPLKQSYRFPLDSKKKFIAILRSN